MYKVSKFFTDLHDNDHPSIVGDTFPRKGITETEERLKELPASDNKQGQPPTEHAEEPNKSGKKTDKK